MQAAVVTELGKPPIYGEFPAPSPTPGTCRLRVTASALSHITMSRASGQHYTAETTVPFVTGVDGSGVRDDGRPVYFLMPVPPHGGMAEQTLVPEKHCIELPNGLDPVLAAAMAVPGMSAWAALRERARFVAGETVLINGATGSSGRMAVQVARRLGAKRIIATGRNPAALAALAALGADVVVPLTLEAAALDAALREHFSAGVDVVLDYLWGDTALRLMAAAAQAGPDGVPMRFVQIGSTTAPTIPLPGAALRSSGLVVMGSGFKSVPLPRLISAITELFAAAAARRFDLAITIAPLAQLVARWTAIESSTRLVFVP